MLEDFDVTILSQKGEKKIGDLSGGERVWIEQALSEAIAIFHSEKSGRLFETAFCDESDGALDPDNKQHFVDMLREAARVGRRQFTFLITQTPEVWQQVQQRLIFTPGQGIHLEY